MVLVVDDKSKDEVLDKIMEKIVALQNEYHNQRGWMGYERRHEIRETIAKHRMNYNTIVVKRANKSTPVKSLYQPIPQSDKEKAELLELIESV